MKEYITTKEAFELFGRGEKWLRIRRDVIRHRKEDTTHGFRYLYLASDVRREHERNEQRLRKIRSLSSYRREAKKRKERRQRRIPEHLIPAFHEFVHDVMDALREKQEREAEQDAG